jgi:hypothetical protein
VVEIEKSCGLGRGKDVNHVGTHLTTLKCKWDIRQLGQGEVLLHLEILCVYVMVATSDRELMVGESSKENSGIKVLLEGPNRD